MKILRIAAIVVGVVALVATGVGALAGAGIIAAGAFTAAAATVASIATIASIALAATITIAGSKPGSLLSGHPEDFRADPQAYLPYMIGRTANAGNIIHRETFGTHGLYQGFVVIWSAGGPVEEIEAFYVDNALTTFGGGGAAIGEYAGFMWLDTQLGACPESSALTSTPGSLPGWDSSSKLSGYAAGLWTLKFDTKGKKFAGGVPMPRTVIKGVKVYDPRLDSTYPGGSGTCRALDEATYVWSENPWLHALTFALGRFQNGKRVLGVGIPVGSIDVPAFVEAANIADANDWKAGGVVYTGDSKWQILKSLAQAGGGECMQLGAKLSCLVSTPRVSLATITSADLVGRASVTATQSRRDRINGVTPRIRSEAHGWEVIPLDVIRGDTYLTEDGQERTREIDYQLVQDADQGAQLAAYDIANAREFGPINLPLKPVWLGYKPGDCLTADIPELGLNAQPCIQLNRELEPSSGIVTFSLRSETAAKHAYALGQTGTAPPTPSLSAPDFSVAAPDEDSWTLVPFALEGSAGETIPILRVTGDVENTNAEAVLFEYRIEGETNWQLAGMGAPDTTSFDIAGVAPGSSYEVAVSYQVRGVKGDQLILGPVTAGDFGIFSAGSAGSSQLLRDDRFLAQWWHIPAPAGRVVWDGSRSGFAATVPFVASTDFRVYYDTADLAFMPRSTEGKSIYVRAVMDPSGFSGLQVVDDDGTPVVDDDGAYVHDADPADFDLEVSIRWLNADGTYNSRSIIGTATAAGGIQTVIGSAVAPVTGFGVIEFGYPSQTGKTGAWTVYEPWEAEYEPAADVTANAQVTVEVAPVRTYEANYLGVISSGLPDTISPRVTRGGANIKTDDAVSYALATSDGVTATRDNTTGSSTKGDITITAVTAQEGWVELTVTVDGVAQPAQRTAIRKNLGSAPATGGSGSKVASTGNFTTITATSYARIAFVGTVTVGSGESLYASASLDYYIDGTSGIRTATVKLRYAPTGTTSWTDIGAAATGYGAAGAHVDGEGYYESASPGHVDYAQSATPSAATYDVEIVALESGTGRTMSFAGIASVEAKV